MTTEKEDTVIYYPYVFTDRGRGVCPHLVVPWAMILANHTTVYLGDPADDEYLVREFVRKALAAPDPDVATATRDLMRAAKRRGYWLSVWEHQDEIRDLLEDDDAFDQFWRQAADNIVTGIKGECS